MLWEEALVHLLVYHGEMFCYYMLVTHSLIDTIRTCANV